MADQRPTTRALEMWTTLQRGLFCLNNAAFETHRPEGPDLEAADMWLDDLRRAIGELALALADAETSAAEGYRLLAEAVVAPPHSAADAAYIERVHRAES